MPISINGSTGISGVDGSASTPALQGSDTNTGISFGSDVILASTGGTERARIDSSGRLLVGTSTTAGAKLHVVGGATAGAVDNAAIFVGGSGTVGSGARIYLSGVPGFETTRGAYIEGVHDTATNAHSLRFATNASTSDPTERMRIDKDGWTNIYHTLDGFQARSSQSAGTTWANFAGRHSATATTNGTISFIVYTNGNVQNTNNSYAGISDIKLKENIVDATSQWNDLKALQVRKYNLKEETGQQTHTQIGLIAQEVELVSPGLVSETPDRDADGNDLGTVTKSVNYSVLYMKAVKALQEAMERIETLETRITALEAQS